MHLPQLFEGAVPWHEIGDDNAITIIPLGRIGFQNIYCRKMQCTFFVSINLVSYNLNFGDITVCKIAAVIFNYAFGTNAELNLKNGFNGFAYQRI